MGSVRNKERRNGDYHGDALERRDYFKKTEFIEVNHKTFLS